MLKNLIVMVCLVATLFILVKVESTINEFNQVITRVEDTSQVKLIDSLQLEIMEIGAELDSMYLKHN